MGQPGTPVLLLSVRLSVVLSALTVALLSASSQTDDALLLAVVAKGDGSLATLAASIQGSSQKLTQIQEVAWHRLPDGRWLWMRQRGDTITYGGKDEPKGEFKPPLSLSGRTWQAAWLEGGQVTLGFYGSEAAPPLEVWSFARTGPDPSLPESARRALEEAWQKLPSREQEEWQAPEFEKGLFGFFRTEGSFVAGLHLARKGDGAALRPGEAGGGRSLLLAAKTSGFTAQAWKSAKSSGGLVYDALASERTGWGLILAQGEVRLAPFSAGQFGRAAKRLTAGGVRFAAFQSWTGSESKTIYDDLRKQRP